MGNPNPDRQFYDHDSGTFVTEDKKVFDRVKWLQDHSQQRSGKKHQRVYDPEVVGLLREILMEAKKQSVYLSILAGEELKDEY